MNRSILRVGAGVAAAALLVGAGVFAFVDRDGRTGRPARALEPGEGGEATIIPVGGPAGTAIPVKGTTAQPYHSNPTRRLEVTPPQVTPWVKRELQHEQEELEAEAEVEAEEEGFGEESRPVPTVETGDEDGALQATTRSGPAVIESFEGLNNANNKNIAGFQLVPSDQNGEVGNGFYVQMVNVTWAVYDVDTGQRVGDIHLLSDLFGGPGQGLCSTHDDGDPVVVYDELAQRWILTQFALDLPRIFDGTSSEKYAECIAISDTADPTGSYTSYQFDYPKVVLNDYPKFGVWPDGYFASFNQFDVTNSGGFNWAGAGAIAYERDAMLAGNPADQVYINLKPIRVDLGGMLPSDLSGTDEPPAGTPNIFAMFDADEWGYNTDKIELWGFHVDFDTPSNSSFDHIKNVPTKAFNPWICGVGKAACIKQKNSTVKLDALNDRLMFRLDYRVVGGEQQMAVTHSVRSAPGESGVRWYQLASSDPETNWSIEQQGTFSPDGKSRWMGSAALDADGNLGVGYSISSGKIFPGVAFAARTTSGAAGKLNLGETKAFNGQGSEKGQYNRWGDYSDLTVAEDGCTFYYTNQYYSKTGQWGWRTRIVSFQVDAGACTV